MNYSSVHNLVEPDAVTRDRRWGIRVTLPANDSLARVIGEDWERTHWYASEAERDSAFENMAARHGYYRKTDSPTQVLEKVSR